MRRIFKSRTLRVTGLKNFMPVSFLKRLHVASLDLQIVILVNTCTEIFFSVSDWASPIRNNADLKFDLLKNMLDGCAFKESFKPRIPQNMVLFHVSGIPKLRKKQMEIFISKLLELDVNSCIFLNLTPIGDSDGNCSFEVSFSIGINKENNEQMVTKFFTVATLIQSIYDTVFMTFCRKPYRAINKLICGEHVYNTTLDLPGTLAYVQLPLTYGIEPLIEMDFPMPTRSMLSKTGIELGVPVEFKIPGIDKIRLDPKRLFEHMAVWGASGTGKTTFLHNFLLKLEKEKVHFTVLDGSNEYRNIVTKMDGKLGDDILILNPFLGSFSINPLEIFESKSPKDIQIWDRIENFISLLKQMYRLGEIQEASLRQALSSLYSRSSSPTISEAIFYMSEMKMNALTLKLDKFTKGFYAQIFNKRKSTLPFSNLKNKNVIIELGQLPAEVRMFFTCVFLILWWDNLRIGDPSPNVLVLDDFNRYGNLSVVRKMLSESRKFKQGLICSHQGPQQLPQGIREELIRNTATKIIFRQEQSWDKHIVRDALGGLTKEQLILLSYMDIGQAMVKLPSAKFPIRIDTPKPPKTKLLLDWEVERTMKNFIGEPEPEEKIHFEEPFEMKFLKEIDKKPQTPLTEITKSLEIKTERGYALKDKLIREGYLEEEKIRQGKGRPRVSLKLTDKGMEYINNRSDKRPTQYGKSEHVLIIKKIASLLKDWDVEIENGCDIMAIKNGYSVAIEVETGKSNDKNQIIYNINRDSSWAEKIVIVSPNKLAKLEIEKLIKGQTKSNVAVITYRQIEKIPSIISS